MVFGPEYSDTWVYGITPTADVTYTAKFEEKPMYTITIRTEPAGLFDGTGEENPLWICDNNKCNEEGTYSLEVREGDTYEISTGTTGFGLSSFLKFDKWECSDGTVLTSYYPGNIQSMGDVQWVAHYVPDFGTYTQVGTTNLYSYDNGYSVDIKGMDDDKFYGSTYSDGGYQAAIKVGDNAATNVYDGLKVDDVQVNTSVLQSGAMARVVYQVYNSGATAQTFSLGTYADVMIGENDQAPVQAIKTDDGKTVGIVMRDGEGGQLYVMFGLGVAGSSLIDDYWFGEYNHNSSANQIVGNYETGFSGYMEENGAYDSGMGWCWKNRTIEPGQTLVYSFLVGIGEVKMEASASVTLTPLDMNTWNDLSVSHGLYAEGIYTHTAGVSGYLEYQVESTNADGWITMATDPATLQSDDYFHAEFSALFDESKAVHTIHFRTRDILGNIMALPSVQYEDIRSLELTGEVVDKVYTGSALTQNVVLAGLETNKYSVRYTDNVDAGTAHMFFEGVYPNTIGRKEYTFTISPKPLEGEIVFYNNEVVYDGEAHQPGWHFSEGYSLTEGVDYTATWSNNILPGKGNLTIKGKGNYTGTLTATFQIKKIAVTSDMYSVKLPLSCQYDGEAHVATAQTIDGVGAATFTYLVNGVAQEPVDGGIYDVVLSIAEGDFYYGISDVPVGTFTIWRMDAAEWTALQAIYDELSVRNWKNRWDMSKGEAGAGSFQGVTFNQGHVVELNLSENEIDGTFPLSVLSLPYMTSLDLSNNSLSGDIEDGIIEYVQAHPIAAPARAKAEENTITVYVQKPAEWSGMNVYSWTDNSELTHSWPGDPMSDRGDGWWVYSGLPVGANVVFNDGTGNSSMQTGDITNIQYSTAYTLQASTGHTSMGNVPYTVASAVVVQNGIILPKGLKTVNISHNELEGNIGLFAQALPKLEALDASYNHIAEVVPMLSTGITNLDLSNQVVLAPRVLDLEAAATDYTSFIASIPTVMLYNHEAQDYTLNSSTLVTIQDGLSNPQFAASAVVVDFENKLWTMNSNGQDNVFRYTSEDVLYVTNEGSTSRFSAKLLFGDGDANFTGTTDVLDLQASINFIFGEYGNARPYNFTAANLFKDEVINVQDIVLLTNILLADEEPSPTPARRMMAAQAEGTETEAELRWERGELHLMSNKPVAALDLIIETDEPIEWQAGAHSVMTKQTRNGQHAVIYSLAGAVFAADTDIVIARTKDLTPRTTKAVLADKEAMPITVRTHTEGANVPTGVDNVQSDNVPCTKVLRDGVLYIIHNGTMYNVQGQLIKK